MKPFASSALTMSAITADTTLCVPLQFFFSSVEYPHLHVPVFDLSFIVSMVVLGAAGLLLVRRDTPQPQVWIIAQLFAVLRMLGHVPHA